MPEVDEPMEMRVRRERPERQKGDKVELFRMESHPLSQKFYDLARELDALPGDIRQTTLMGQLHNLQRATQELLNDPAYLAKV